MFHSVGVAIEKALDPFLDFTRGIKTLFGVSGKTNCSRNKTKLLLTVEIAK